jgi:hypothetical protein
MAVSLRLYYLAGRLPIPPIAKRCFRIRLPDTQDGRRKFHRPIPRFQCPEPDGLARSARGDSRAAAGGSGRDGRRVESVLRALWRGPSGIVNIPSFPARRREMFAFGRLDNRNFLGSFFSGEPQ